MLNRRNSILVILSSAILTMPLMAQAQTRQTAAKSTLTKKGYVLANGVNYYYEIHGRGEPLLLLHGGLGSMDMFRPTLPQFAKGRQGRTPGDLFPARTGYRPRLCRRR